MQDEEGGGEGEAVSQHREQQQHRLRAEPLQVRRASLSILWSEGSTFGAMFCCRPIKAAPLSPPKKLEDGRMVRPSLVRAQPRGRNRARKIHTPPAPSPPPSLPAPAPAPYPAQSSPSPSLLCRETLPASLSDRLDTPSGSPIGPDKEEAGGTVARGEEGVADTGEREESPDCLAVLLEEGGLEGLGEQVRLEEGWNMNCYKSKQARAALITPVHIKSFHIFSSFYTGRPGVVKPKCAYFLTIGQKSVTAAGAGNTF